MFIPQELRIGNADHFIPSRFPQLADSLQQVAAQLAKHPPGPQLEMILSFVKDHRIDSKQAGEYPALADLISTKAIPLHVMETLFESARQNHLFKKQLEEYIRTYLINQNL